MTSSLSAFAASHTGDNNMIRSVPLGDVCIVSRPAIWYINPQNHPRVSVSSLCRLRLNEAVLVRYPVLVIISFSRHGHTDDSQTGLLILFYLNTCVIVIMSPTSTTGRFGI